MDSGRRPGGFFRNTDYKSRRGRRPQADAGLRYASWSDSNRSRCHSRLVQYPISAPAMPRLA